MERGAALAKRMEEANAAKQAELDKAVDQAEELGETEVREALQAKAQHLCRIGDRDGALSAYRVLADKTLSLNQQLDISFVRIRMGLFWGDHDLVRRSIEKAKFDMEAGAGDWDRKNRLKVYEGVHQMSIRDFDGAASNFLDTLSTFTYYELFDYTKYIYYTCLCSIMALDRVQLKERVIDSPEVLSAINDVPYLSDLLNALYRCEYDKFFVALAAITEGIKRDHWLSQHCKFFCREMRIRAYSQLLESYKSVHLERMAAEFGVTASFLDKEVSRFIASGRLHCKIDSVDGVITTSRHQTTRIASYEAVLQRGDALLNRVQRLSKVVNM